MTIKYWFMGVFVTLSDRRFKEGICWYENPPNNDIDYYRRIFSSFHMLAQRYNTPNFKLQPHLLILDIWDLFSFMCNLNEGSQLPPLYVALLSCSSLHFLDLLSNLVQDFSYPLNKKDNLFAKGLSWRFHSFKSTKT